MQPCPQWVENVMQLLFPWVFIRDSSLNIKALFTKADHDMLDYVVWEPFTSPQIECDFCRTRNLVWASSAVPGTPQVLINCSLSAFACFELRKLIYFSQPPIYFTSLYLVPTLSQFDSRYWGYKYHSRTFMPSGGYVYTKGEKVVCYFIYPATTWIKLTTWCWVKDARHRRVHSV